jgi:hypothetical protein
MKNIKSITLLTGILVVISVISLSAQNRDAKTSSARAAYGMASAPTNYKANNKTKNKSKHKAHKNKQAKASRDKSPAYRKRNNWAS